MTKVAWHLKKDQIQNSDPGETRKKFVFSISQSEYRKEWGHIYEKPSFFARVKAFFIRLVPKAGPFSALGFHSPTPVVEQMYMHSFNETLALYQKLLLGQGEGRLRLENDNLDTGGATEAGAYRPADKSYATLLSRLNGKPVSDDLRRNILEFYADLEKPFATKKNPREWKNVLQELDMLKAEEK
jgi:hypothetical protein